MVLVSSRIVALNRRLLETLGDYSQIYVIVFKGIAVFLLLIEGIALFIGVRLDAIHHRHRGQALSRHGTREER